MMIKTIEKEFNKITEIIGNHFQNKSVLITGANGLIGSYLTDYLSYVGADTYAMSRSLEKLKKRFKYNSNINLIAQDLNNSFEIEQTFDYIIHAASNSHPISFSTDPVGTMKTNLLGTMNLLEHIKHHGGKLLYISSGEIYGNNIDHAFTENDLGIIDSKSVRSCYPESKRAAETLCISYNAQYNINVNIARLCYIYGPTITDTNSRADAQFLRNALNKENIILKSKGLQKRTYCYIADAVSAILYILLHGENAGVYNVANQNSIVTVAEYAQILANLANVKLEFAIPDEIEAKGYSKQADSILSAEKLVKLGWYPVYSIDEGLKNTLKIKKEVKC